MRYFVYLFINNQFFFNLELELKAMNYYDNFYCGHIVAS